MTVIDVRNLDGTPPNPASSTARAAPSGMVSPACRGPADSHVHAWAEYDRQGVRPYVLTGGRTQPRHPMRLETLLATTGAAAAGGLAPEATQAVGLCRSRPRSVAEIAATTALPAPIAKILLSDLIDRGVLTPAQWRAGTLEPDRRHVLEALLEGLRSMPDVA